MKNWRPIQIWEFWEAPEEIRELSPSGDDADWIAILPREIYDNIGIPSFLESGVFGNFVCQYLLPTTENKDILLVSFHA